MARDRKAEVNAAAQAASEAARTLQAAGQAKKSEAPQAPKVEVQADPGAMAKALKNRPSSQAMDEILAKRGLDKEEEVKEEPKVEAPKEEPKAEEADETKAEPVVEEVKAEAPPVVEAPKTVRVKIDGEETEVAQSEVDEAGGIVAYQRDKASEKRLAEAKAILAEAKRMKAEAPKEPEKPSVSRQQFITERMDKIRFGTPEEAAQAQLEIMEYGKEKPVDQNQISNQVMERIKNENAVAKFKTEFADIASNPVLFKAAIAIERERLPKLLEAGGPIDHEKFYRTIGNEIRSAVGRPHQSATQTTQTASTTSSPSKEEKKAGAVVTLPTAGARAALPKEDKEPTPDEERKSWFAETKKARGQ